MTEIDLFEAVHEYERSRQVPRPASVRIGEEAEDAARAKLLEAIEKYAQDRIAKLPSPLATLIAKAAVCDALLAENVSGKGGELHDAVKSLRELQEKAK